MELLPEGTDNSTQVTFEDQQQINKFSTLISRYDRLQHDLKNLNNEIEQIDDVALELELLDDDDLVDYHIGGRSADGLIINDGCFVKLKQSKVLQNLELESEKINFKVVEINNEINSLSETLSKIKSSLYAKFGNAINLER